MSSRGIFYEPSSALFDLFSRRICNIFQWFGSNKDDSYNNNTDNNHELGHDKFIPHFTLPYVGLPSFPFPHLTHIRLPYLSSLILKIQRPTADSALRASCFLRHLQHP